MYLARICVLLCHVDTLNAALCATLRDFMDERGITGKAVAARLDRSPDYVSGRLRGRLPLSVDIVVAVAQLAGISDRALMSEIMIRAASTGQGSSER
jgi:transcriptional regulator with XRE-family HTH domain